MNRYDYFKLFYLSDHWRYQSLLNLQNSNETMCCKSYRSTSILMSRRDVFLRAPGLGPVEWTGSFSPSIIVWFLKSQRICCWLNLWPFLKVFQSFLQLFTSCLGLNSRAVKSAQKIFVSKGTRKCCVLTWSFWPFLLNYGLRRSFSELCKMYFGAV